MGNPKAIFATGITVFSAAATIIACGSDSAKTPDASVKLIDAAPDAKAVDAAPDAPAYDFTCFGSAQGSSAPTTITIAGTTYKITQSGSAALPGVVVGAYKTGVPAALGSATSNGSGAFTINNVPTGGMPLDGYLKAAISTYRTTYLYPPNPLTADVAMTPVTLISDAAFTFLANYAMVTQDDSANGVVLVAAVDCQDKPISGATLTVQQGGSDVGTAKDLSALGVPATVVFNVPDGVNTDVGASFGGMTFPPHTVLAHKLSTGSNAEGSLTITVVRPGP